MAAVEAVDIDLSVDGRETAELELGAIYGLLLNRPDDARKALQRSERRPDALLFDLCAQILIGVQSRGLEPALRDRLPEIRRAAIEYSASDVKPRASDPRAPPDQPSD
jgi:hypothetical protein